MADIKIYGTLKNVTNEPIANAEQIGNLATVATSGSYNDLNDKPTIPTNTSDLNNDSKFVSEDDIEGEKKRLPGDEYSINITASTVIDSTGRVTSSNNENFYAQTSSAANSVIHPIYRPTYYAFLPSGGTYNTYKQEIELCRIHIPIDCIVSGGVIHMQRGSIEFDTGNPNGYFYIRYIDKQGTEQQLVYETNPSVIDHYLIFSETPKTIKGDTDIIITCREWIHGDEDSTKATRAGIEENLIIVGEPKEKYVIPTKNSELTNDIGFLTQHQDISGKQDVLVSGTNIKTINNNSIVGSGNLSVGTITGITMNGGSKGTSGVVNLGTVLTSTIDSAINGSGTPITSGGVYNALQNYEAKLIFTNTTSTSIGAKINNYYNITTNVSTLVISLPTSSLVAGDTCAFNFTTSSNFISSTISGGTIKKMKDFHIEKNSTYEIVALYDGSKWLVTITEFE